MQFAFDMLITPLNGALPCVLEYWMMDLCIPLGITGVLFVRAWGQRDLRTGVGMARGAVGIVEGLVVLQVSWGGRGGGGGVC